jgi:hypothetical protein
VRFWRGLLIGLAAVTMTGCTNSASAPPSSGQSPATAASTGPPAAKATPIPPGAKTGARAAAVQFDRVYAASDFADSWDLLTPIARRQVSKSVWVRVHNGCQSASTEVTRTIRSVTAFGDAAIVTETIATAPSKRSTAEYVYNYVGGRWGYSPENLSIYHRGSIAADIAAARSAGFCSSGKAF